MLNDPYCRTSQIILWLLLSCALAGAQQVDTNTARTPTQQPARGASTSKVTWAEGTVILDAETVRQSLRRSEPKVGRYVFASTNSEIENLRAGNVLLLGGLALRRVTGVVKKDGEVTVETVAASLNEVIKDGVISWQTEVRFNAPRATSNRRRDTPATEAQFAAMLFGETVPLSPPSPDEPLRAFKTVAAVFNDDAARLNSASAINFLNAVQSAQLETDFATKFEDKLKGYDVSLKLIPKSDKLNIELEVKKVIANGEGFKLTVKGSISGFTSEGTIRYEQSTLREFFYQHRNLTGEMKISVVGVKMGTQEAAFAIPLKIPIPIQIGPIPAKINIMATIQITPQLYGESSSRGEFSINYSADHGLRVTNGQPTTTGAVNNPQLRIQHGNTAGMRPVGLGIDVEFPRFELELLGERIVPCISINSHLYGYFSPLVNICQESGVKLSSDVGYTLKLLGKQEWTGKKTIWEKDQKVNAGVCK